MVNTFGESLVPVNSKSFLAFIFRTMKKLDCGEISCNEALAQAKLMSQANNIFEYELKRTITQIKLQEVNGVGIGRMPTLREIESKGFTDTTNIKED